MDDVRKHAKKYSKSFSNGPWQDELRRDGQEDGTEAGVEIAPLKSDFVRCVAADETIKTEISEDMYAVPSEEVEIEDVPDEVIDAETGELHKHRCKHRAGSLFRLPAFHCLKGAIRWQCDMCRSITTSSIA